MKQINSITSDPNQETIFVLDSGENFVLNLVYRPTIQRWVMNLTYGSIVIKEAILCVHPNILRHERKRIPFGIAIVSSDDVDPIENEAFSGGRVSMYVLNSDDVDYVESRIAGLK